MSARAEAGLEITRLLKEAREGSPDSVERLMSAVYEDLRHVARRVMSGEAAEHTLQPTAVVNETFLRLFHPPDLNTRKWTPAPVDWQNRAHFLAVAARQMRRVLIDHARQRKAAKRGGGVKISLDDASAIAVEPQQDFHVIDELLDLLAAKDPAAAQVVELKFFGGLTDREAALVMGTSTAKVRRDWEFARSWLRRQMGRREKT